MTRLRLTLPAHGLIELVAGIALVVAAFALDLGAAGTILTFVGGVLVAGVGLGASESMSLALHRALDNWLVVGLAVAAVFAAFQGGALAAAVLLAAATTLVVLGATTRWTRPPLTR